ncbi:PAS domain S-box protein [Halostella sp. JP-L12]|uniref:PAS domain S-box protein n=1 Tax=Halostella TaxID=1843185 RepID=UPI000EF7997A|nr:MULTISPECIES: PAS domain S-box protein [Halostella]NHN47781.1 PAS domain S-box protein [Halostella sp. JP-L12]
MGPPSTSDVERNAWIRQQEVVAELGQRALESADIDELLHDAAARVADALNAEYAAVLDLRPDADEAVLRAGVGWPAELVRSATVPVDRGSMAGWALTAREAVVAADLRSEERFSRSELLAGQDAVSGIAAAVGSEGDPWGVLSVHATEQQLFTDHDAAFVENVAGLLASAVRTRRERSDPEEIYGRISDAFVALDDEWRFTHLNERARELIGREERTLVGEHVRDAFPDAVVRPFEDRFERAVREQETVSFEEYVPEPLDGWFEVRAYPSETGLSVYLRDVTERKRAQQQLAEERDMFAAGPTIVFRWRDEEGWPVEYVSRNVEDVLGYAPEELESGDVPYTDLLLDEEIDRVAREVEENTDGTTERFSHEPYRVRTKGGDVRWVKDTTKIVRDEAGGVDHYLGYLVDVTERKERERELRRYETIVETINDGIYVKDDAGRFTMVNEAYAEMLGYEPEELLGEHASLVVDEEVVEEARRTEASMLDGEEDNPVVEAEMKTASGDRLPAEATFAMLSTADGNEQRVGVVRDISDRKERERELERYERIVENLPVGVYRNTPGPDGEFVAANATLASIFDADSVEDLLEHDVSDLYPDPDQRAEFSRTLEREGIVEGHELKQETLDGETIWISVTAIRVEEDGEVYFDGTVQDITERKERQRKLKRTERRFEAIFEDPNILVGLLEPDGTVLDINRTAMEYIDADLADVTGEPFWETPWWGEGDDVAADVREWTERAAEGEYVDFQADLTRPDGERYTLEGFFRPVTNDDGEVVSIVVSDRDVTERKLREQALQESKNQLRALIDLLPVAVFVAESDGRIVEWNEAAKEIWGGEIVESDSVAEYDQYDGWWVDTGEPVEPEEWALARALQGEEVTDPDVIEIEGFDGERRTVLNHGMPVRDADGEVSRAVVTLIDITERKEYQRKLEESNERLEQFAYAASHDLQEPLRMVSSYLQLIEDRYADELDEDGREFLEFAVDGANRMRNMIQGLLKYSRVDTRGDSFEPVDLDDVLADVRSDLQVKIVESGADITVGDLPRVEGDEGQLRQLFQNLLDNAIEYSGDEPPRVRVAAERTGGRWTVSVSDEGIGIDPDDADAVFEVFESLHAPDEHGGTGIGLALCERIVERHGGEIRVSSEPGEGATFTFTLPAADDAGA